MTRHGSFLTSTWPDGVWSSLRSSDTWRDGRKYALPGETENAHLGPARPRTLDFTSFPVRTDTGTGGPSALRTFNTFSKSDCRQLCLLNSFCRSFAMRKTKSGNNAGKQWLRTMLDIGLGNNVYRNPWRRPASSNTPPPCGRGPSINSLSSQAYTIRLIMSAR